MKQSQKSQSSKCNTRIAVSGTCGRRPSGVPSPCRCLDPTGWLPSTPQSRGVVRLFGVGLCKRCEKGNENYRKLGQATVCKSTSILGQSTFHSEVGGTLWGVASCIAQDNVASTKRGPLEHAKVFHFGSYWSHVIWLHCLLSCKL